MNRIDNTSENSYFCCISIHETTVNGRRSYVLCCGMHFIYLCLLLEYLRGPRDARAVGVG